MTRDELNRKVLDDVRERWGDKVLFADLDYGDPVAIVDRSIWHDLMEWLKGHEEWGFLHFIDITGVDHYQRFEGYRFELVVHLRSPKTNVKLRIKTRLAEGDATAPTLTDIWVGASWSEREVYDLMGITFEGHPRMERLLNPDDFEGYALRKDFPVKGRHRGSFPRGTVISNKRREAHVAPSTRPRPADQILPNTPVEMRREAMKPRRPASAKETREEAPERGAPEREPQEGGE